MNPGNWNVFKGQPKHENRSAIKSASRNAKARNQKAKMKRHHKKNRQCKYRRHR